MKRLYFSMICFIGLATLRSQSLSDGIYMPRKVICVGALATQDSWDEYYEGTLLRSNGNIGTVTTQMVGVMANYGIRNRLNVIGALPFVKTSASAGSLAGQRGVQDLTLGLKYKAYEKQIKGGAFSAQLAGVVTIPVTNYVADYLPLSIGMRSKTATCRLMLHYLHPKGLTFTLHGGYTTRGAVKLDRNSFYTTQLIENDKVVMPDVLQYGARMGYYTYRLQGELLFDVANCTSGNDIRRQDMPFLTNRMQGTRAGVFLSYRIKPLRDLQVIASAQQVLTGQNVGKSTTYTFGLMKAFGPSSTATTTN
jgi:hypothetical protein